MADNAPTGQTDLATLVLILRHVLRGVVSGSAALRGARRPQAHGVSIEVTLAPACVSWNSLVWMCVGVLTICCFDGGAACRSP